MPRFFRRPASTSSRPRFCRPQLLVCEERLSLGDALLGQLLWSGWLAPALAAPLVEAVAAEAASPSRMLDNPMNAPALSPASQGPAEESRWTSAPDVSQSVEVAVPPVEPPFSLTGQAAHHEADTLAFLAGTPLPSPAAATGGAAPVSTSAPAGTATPGGTSWTGPVHRPMPTGLGGALLNGFAGQPIPPATSAPSAPSRTGPAPTEDQVRANLARQPLEFEANQGQTDPQVQFLARGAGYTTYLTSTGAVMLLKQPEVASRGRPAVPAGPAVAGLSMQVVGGNPAARGTGEERLPGVIDYHHGNDPSRWVTGVSTYAAVRFANVYPGIDLRYHGQERQLEYDFQVAPDANPSAIQLAFPDADQVVLSPQGDLILRAGGTELRNRPPSVYQDIDGVRHPVDGAFVLGDGGQVGFRLGAYDRTRPLVIDPVVIYSTYVGGSGSDIATAIAFAPGGADVFITGTTDSPPASFMAGSGGIVQAGLAGANLDVFVTELDFLGNHVRTGIFGGSGDDSGFGIAVNSGGRVFVVGETNSPDYPTAAALAPYNATWSGGTDAFLTVFDSTTFISSTYFGGSGNDSAYGVAVYNSEWAVITGVTDSIDLPTTGGAFQPAHSSGGADADGWVAELNPFFGPPAILFYCSYVGDAGGNDWGQAVTIDPTSGDTYVAGYTDSPSGITSLVPWTVLTGSGGGDGFVLKLQIHTGNPIWYAQIGDSGYDFIRSIAWYPTWSLVYVAGETNSPTFSAFIGPATAYSGQLDGFVARLADFGPTCSPVDYTYLGGGLDDSVSGIAVDPNGAAYVTGYTQGAAFPVLSPPAPSYGVYGGGAADAFVAMLNPTTLLPNYSFYLGGPGTDVGMGIVYQAGAVEVVGWTDSTPGFPLVAPSRPAGVGTEGFVTKIR